MPNTLDKNYERAGYHFKQNIGTRPALILVDFAEAYFDEGCPLYGGPSCENARLNAIKLAEVARFTNVPLILTEVKYQVGGKDGGAFYSKVPALSCFDAGQETQKLVDGLTVLPGDFLITKQYPSAFFGTALASHLSFSKIDTLIIAGLTTSGCVRATCVDSISYGFVTLIVEDACGDRAEEPHEANLFDMSAKYADLISTQQTIKYMKKLKTR